MADQTAVRESKVEKVTLNKVPAELRKTWLDVSMIQAGCYICVPSLLLGGLLIDSMSFPNAMLACGLGYLLSCVITAVIAIIGEDLGVPTCVVGMASFGKSGARLIISALFAIAMIGWFSAQNGVCGQAMSTLFAQVGINIPVTVSTGIWGVIMLTTAVYGIDGLKWLNYIAVPALAIIMAVGTWLAVGQYGTAALADPGQNSMSILDGVLLTGSFLSVGMTCGPDFTRYQKSRGGVITSTFLGIWFPGFILGVMGAALTRLTGQNDLSMILADIGLPILGAVILILATWTTNTTNAYSSGINMVMFFKLKDDKRAITTLIAGAIGTVIAMAGFGTYFETFVNILGVFFFPVAGVMGADYWLLRKGDPDRFSWGDGINWAGIIGWIVGCVISWFWSGIGMIVGFLAAGLIYLLLYKALSCKEVHQIVEGVDIEV